MVEGSKILHLSWIAFKPSIKHLASGTGIGISCKLKKLFYKISQQIHFKKPNLLPRQISLQSNLSFKSYIWMLTACPI
jgi:hypothetical protein